nr:hypothetical protein [Rhizobium sp. ACO-34A]
MLRPRGFLPNCPPPNSLRLLRRSKRQIRLSGEGLSQSSVNLLQLDDLDVADLAADHLDDADSWMSRCVVGSGEFAEHLLDELDRLNAGPWTGWVRRTTDLFWALENGRIVPLHLADRGLRARGASSVEIAFDRESLDRGTRTRRIVPNLLTVFLLLSILRASGF